MEQLPKNTNVPLSALKYQDVYLHIDRLFRRRLYLINPGGYFLFTSDNGYCRRYGYLRCFYVEKYKDTWQLLKEPVLDISITDSLINGTHPNKATQLVLPIPGLLIQGQIAINLFFNQGFFQELWGMPRNWRLIIARYPVSEHFLLINLILSLGNKLKSKVINSIISEPGFVCLACHFKSLARKSVLRTTFSFQASVLLMKKRDVAKWLGLGSSVANVLRRIDYSNAELDVIRGIFSIYRGRSRIEKYIKTGAPLRSILDIHLHRCNKRIRLLTHLNGHSLSNYFLQALRNPEVIDTCEDAFFYDWVSRDFINDEPINDGNLYFKLNSFDFDGLRLTKPHARFRSLDDLFAAEEELNAPFDESINFPDPPFFDLEKENGSFIRAIKSVSEVHEEGVLADNCLNHNKHSSYYIRKILTGSYYLYAGRYQNPHTQKITDFTLGLSRSGNKNYWVAKDVRGRKNQDVLGDPYLEVFLTCWVIKENRRFK